MDIIEKLRVELGIRREQVEATIKLIDEGNTIPFADSVYAAYEIASLSISFVSTYMTNANDGIEINIVGIGGSLNIFFKISVIRCKFILLSPVL